MSTSPYAAFIVGNGCDEVVDTSWVYALVQAIKRKGRADRFPGMIFVSVEGRHVRISECVKGEHSPDCGGGARPPGGVRL